MSVSIVQQTRLWTEKEASLIGETLLMPLRPGKDAGGKELKSPMYKHKDGEWTRAKADNTVVKLMGKTPPHLKWGLLLDGVFVIDADDEMAVAIVEGLADRFPELLQCP